MYCWVRLIGTHALMFSPWGKRFRAKAFFLLALCYGTDEMLVG
jgi:hypothetical protein